MSCAEGTPRQGCEAQGATGLPPILQTSEDKYIRRVVKDVKFPHLPQYARRQMKTLARLDARANYRAALQQAFVAGRLDAQQAIERVGLEAFSEIVAAWLEDELVKNDPPIQTPSGWLTEEAYRELAVPPGIEGYLTNADRESLFRRIRQKYEKKVSAAIEDGLLELDEARRLVAPLLAHEAYWQRYRKIGHTLSAAEYEAGLYGVAMHRSRRELREEHVLRVEIALQNGVTVPDAVLAEYPQLVAEYRPWTMTLEQWAYAQQDRINSPTVVYSLYRRDGEKGLGAGLDRTRDQAAARLEEARRNQPGQEWEIEEIPYGSQQVRYRVVGKTVVWPEEEVSLNELAPLHRKIMIRALEEGQAIPPGVLLAYPDLISEYGMGG